LSALLSTISVENWEDLGNPLSQRPSHESVRNRNSVNIAPLQFTKKISRIHGRVISKSSLASTETFTVPMLWRGWPMNLWIARAVRSD